MKNEKWGTGNGERGTGNREWGMGNGERGTVNGEWGMGNGERGTGKVETESAVARGGGGVFVLSRADAPTWKARR